MNIRILLAGFVLMATSVFAADIDGKWAGNIETPGGAITLAYTFKADGAVLTGSMTGPDGSEIKFTDGKIEGNKFTFTVTTDFGALTFNGVIAGTEAKLMADFGGMPFEIALKKA